MVNTEKLIVQVMSRKDFEDYIREAHNTKSIAISITGSDEDLVPQEPIRESGCNVISIYRAIYDDVDRDEGITRQQAKEMAEFIKHCVNSKSFDKIIVHCGAGQSRSAGVAAAILKWMTNDDMQIFGNPKYTPNMRCFRFMLEALFFEN